MSKDFRLDLGHVAPNFVATLARRLDKPEERLTTPADLDRWLSLSRLSVVGAHARDRDLADARQLRESIYAALAASVEDRPIPRAAIAEINRWARRHPLRPQLTSRRDLRWFAERPVPQALAAIAAETVELLGGTLAPRLRKCADETCSLFFVDHSRASRRRWCSMERCGNKSKTRTYRTGQNRPG
jgi:predicted RNA-binding Zn ribbon-like protein